MTPSHLDKVYKLQQLSRVVNKLSKADVEYRLVLDHASSPNYEHEEEVIVLESRLRKGLGKGQDHICLVKQRRMLGINNTKKLFSSCIGYVLPEIETEPGLAQNSTFSQQELDLVLDVVGHIKKGEEPKLKPKQPVQNNKKELQFMLEPEYTPEELEHINKRLE